jgi:superoxide reductase
MAAMRDLYQSADWKKEKHAPAIEAPEKAAKGQPVTVTVSVGREIAHPNQTQHHIRWIEVYFHPEGAKFPQQLGTSTVYTNPSAVCTFKTDRPGTIIASSYCNIHGLWESSKPLAIA